ncbi:MAG: hypothetical protein FWE42_04430 [Defluviitaleaceae bacterium]|nr:hypothetical protein [Defluviitaleaceae bacterium]
MEDYNIKLVKYVCPTCGEESKKSLFSKKVKCSSPNCAGYATQRDCPLCNHTIPKIALETPNLPFSIIGVATSGKTVFITTMLDEIRSVPELGLNTSHQNNDTRDHQKANYDLIYENRIPPESTSTDSPDPQLWYIQNGARGGTNFTPAYSFTIFDGAGERIENAMTISSEVANYIRISKAILLVLDPLTLRNVKRGGIVSEEDMLHSFAGLEAETKIADAVLTETANVIKQLRGIDTSKKLSIPVAVVLTKFDTVINHPAFAPDAHVKKRKLPIASGRLSMEEIDTVHDEIRYWLEAVREQGFLQALENNFEEFKLFGVSSMGAPPKSADVLPEIRPHRVLDPILWMLKMADFID